MNWHIRFMRSLGTTLLLVVCLFAITHSLFFWGRRRPRIWFKRPVIKNRKANIGSNVMFDCRTNDLLATVTLRNRTRRNNNYVWTDVIPRPGKVLRSETGLFVIMNLQMSDEGWYHCRAKFALVYPLHGTPSYLDVQQPEVPAVRVIPPLPTTLMTGDSVNFTCLSNSLTAKLKWLEIKQDNREVDVPGNRTNLTVTGGNSLLVLMVVNAKSGSSIYKCFMIAGSQRNYAWASLLVCDAPGSPKLFNREMQHRSCSIQLIWVPTSPINFYCPVDHYTVQYRLVYSEIRSSPWFVLNTTKTNTQLPLQCNTYYEFSIRASNKRGTSAFDRKHTKRIKSGSSDTNRALSLEVDWKTCRKIALRIVDRATNDTMKMYSYRVEREDPHGQYWQKIVTNITFIIGELEPHTIYRISVTRLFSGDGNTTNTSLPIFVYTDEDVPNKLVSPTIETKSSRGVLITWKQITADVARGWPTGYVVRYKQFGDHLWQNISVGQDVTEVTIKDLLPYTTYTITMAAKTFKGTGPFGFGINVTTNEAAPDRTPKDIQLSDKNLSWTGVPRKHWNAARIVYDVRYKRHLGIEHQVVTNETTVELQYLHLCSQYNVSIAAVSTGGRGPVVHEYVNSSSVLETSRPTIKNRELETKECDVRLMWKYDEENACHVISQTIMYRPAHFIPPRTAWLYKHVSSQYENVRLDLMCNTFYEFRVCAEFAGGLKNCSGYKVILIGVSRNSSVIAIATSSTSIKVSWTFISWANAFNVIYTNLQNGRTGTQYHCTSTLCVINGLEKSASYSFEVRASSSSREEVIGIANQMTDEDVPGQAVYDLRIDRRQLHWCTHRVLLNGRVKGFRLYIWETDSINRTLHNFTFSREAVDAVRNMNITDSCYHKVLPRQVRPFTNYSMSISVFNKKGEAEKSDVYNFTTPEEAPSDILKEINVSALASTKMLVTWKKLPKELLGGVLRYYLMFILDFDKPFPALRREKVKVSDNDTEVKLLDGLKPYTKYCIWIAAVTVSPGRGSFPRCVTTKEKVPVRAPVVTKLTSLGPFSALVEWDHLSRHMANGRIIAYVLNITEEPRNCKLCDIASHRMNGTINNTTITKLRAYTNYSLVIRAFTSAGGGPWSNWTTLRTNETFPALPPRNLTALNITSVSIQVTWQPIPQDYWRGEKKGYVVKVEKTSGVHRTKRTVFNLTGLRPYTNYTIRVAGVSSGGRGTQANFSEMTLEGTPSSKPSSLSIIHRTLSTLHLRWNPIPDSEFNGVPAGYAVKYKREGEAIWQSEYAKDSTAVLKELEENTKYFVSVAGRTRGGVGAWSETRSFFTDNTKHVIQPPIEMVDRSKNDHAKNTTVGLSIAGAVLVASIIAAVILKRKKRKRMSSDQYEVPPELLKYQHDIGQGAFGFVFKAILYDKDYVKKTTRGKGLHNKGHDVAVKTMHEGATEDEKREFLKEMVFMANVGKHPNIVNFIGYCMRSEPPSLVLEFAEYGDLLTLLRTVKKRKNSRSKHIAEETTGFASGTHTKQATEDSLINKIQLKKESSTGGCPRDGTFTQQEQKPDRGLAKGRSGSVECNAKEQVAESARNVDNVTRNRDEERNENSKTENGNLYDTINTLTLSQSEEDLETTDGDMYESMLRRVGTVKKPTNQQKIPDLGLTNLMSFGWQISKGMDSNKTRLTGCKPMHLLEGPTEDEKREFLKEMVFMANVGKHPNIVNFIGYCMRSEPPSLVLEFAEYGDLLTLLRTVKKDFLSSKGLIHRDLAARNILVSKGLVAKVSDFGLMRSLSQEAIYHTGAGRKLPIRWTAPEALIDMEFTTSSDVWSFGITLWEIMTLGENPYPAFDNTEVLIHVKNGGQLQKPAQCPDEIFGIMESCWKMDPSERPHFALLKESLDNILMSMADYTQLSADG